MDYFKIDGKPYDVLVTELEENFTILYSENTGRTLGEGATMVLDPIGTFYGHKVTVKRKRGYESVFDELFDYISKPRYVGMAFDIVHNQSTIHYNGYISNGARKLIKIDESTGKVYWDAISLKIVPMEAYITPEEEVE
jgi:hypothetical protein